MQFRQERTENYMSDISTLTKIAKNQIGCNGSKYRKWFYDRTTDYYGVNWCAVFISWLFNEIGGINRYVTKTDGAGCFAREGDGKTGKWYQRSEITPKEGDIITFRWGGTYTDKYHSDHVGYVYQSDGNYVYTVEGNTNSNNPDYSVVAYKYYSLNNSAINGYFRPHYRKQSDENPLEIQKGDKGNFVLAYKSLLTAAKMLGIIQQNVDKTDSFGDGTYKATVELQKKYHLDVDGIAGVQTLTALRNAITEALTDSRKTVIAEIISHFQQEMVK